MPLSTPSQDCEIRRRHFEGRLLPRSTAPLGPWRLRPSPLPVQTPERSRVFAMDGFEVRMQFVAHLRRLNACVVSLALLYNRIIACEAQDPTVDPESRRFRIEVLCKVWG
jgi:hypothetical protein